MKTFTFLVLFTFLLTGCANNITLSGHNVSNVDATIVLDKSASVTVISNAEGDQLTNKRYIPNVIAALQARGFSNVSDTFDQSDYTVKVNFRSESKIETIQVPIFNHAQNLPYTICRRDLGTNTRTCITRYRNFMDPIVSGYKSVQTPINIYTFRYTLTDKQNHLILDSTNTVVNKDCSKWNMFEFLSKDAISRANFNDPIDTPYEIEMPPTYQCQ
ncbi:hypothetical protein [Marinomonas profundimaris]|jgi:hypothetical protein|uniref:Lipoprotein n=1 Tax=Marinomonas profundimaris TaxID=1208321 RepID=W1RR67_9GAMM|nr:hypothetical protein [Marinomonas profundimaris]ETI59372.1 hypothetical protein D104_13465 [Marinomonas profundimaris]